MRPFWESSLPINCWEISYIQRTHALWCMQTTHCSVITSVPLLPPLPGWMVQSDNYNSCCSPDWLTSDFWPPVGHFNWLMYNEWSSLKQGYFEAREEKALMLEGSNLICRLNWWYLRHRTGSGVWVLCKVCACGMFFFKSLKYLRCLTD